MKNIGLLTIRIFKQTEDGGAKPYTHNIRKSNKIKDGLKFTVKRNQEVEKSGEKLTY